MSNANCIKSSTWRHTTPPLCQTPTLTPQDDTAIDTADKVTDTDDANRDNGDRTTDTNTTI